MAKDKDTTRRVTLTNDFHHSAVTLMVGEDGKLNPGQVRRARRALCGISGCTCAGNLGERGPQAEAAPNDDGTQLEFRNAETGEWSHQ